MRERRPETLVELLADAATRHHDEIAVASQDGLRTFTLTYGDLKRAAENVAAELTNAHRLQKGDRVVLWAPNSARLVAVQFGILRAGLIAVPLDQNARSDFVAAVIEQTEAQALISLPQRAAGILPPVLDINAFDLRTAAAFNGPGPGPDCTALIIFTSGTTGDPKGVVLTHANTARNAQAAAGIIPERVRLGLLSILPLSHMLEQTAGLHLPLLSGGSVHYARSLQPSAVLRDIRRRRVNGMVVVPRFLQMLVVRIEQQMNERGLGGVWRLRRSLARALPFRFRRTLFVDVRRAFGGRLDFFICGGASLPAATFAAWEEMGVRIIEGYGTTECAPVIAANTYTDRVAGSVGFPLTGVETRISAEGELQVRGPNVFPGYWQAPERTAATFTEDGWYRTGDLASSGPDGRIRIEARLSERIVLPSGMNVYPADVEAVLSEEDAVAEAVVLGHAEAEAEEHVHAVIRPVQDADRSLVEQAVASANRRLASHQRIHGFSLWEGDFPRTALHKVKRGAVRATLSHETPTKAPTAAKAEQLGMAAQLLRRVAPAYKGEIRGESHIENDLGLDSLGRIELAALIETETGVEFSEDQINGLETVADLGRLLDEPHAAVERLRFDEWPLGQTAITARRLLQAALLFPIHRAFCRPFRIEGRENLQGLSSPLLCVANHTSHVDTVSIIRALPWHLRRRTVAAAAADYFYRVKVLGWIASLLLNTFPFSRASNVRDSLQRCGELCDRGWSILIYPEGTRSPDGSLLQFKSGASLLASGLRVPVIPIAVRGGHDVLPKGRRWPKRAPVTIRFGAPLEVAKDADVMEVTGMLRRAVAAELGGQG